MATTGHTSDETVGGLVPQANELIDDYIGYAKGITGGAQGYVP